MQIFVVDKLPRNKRFNRRWVIILIALIFQGVIVAMVLNSFKQPAQSDAILLPVQGDPTLCYLVRSNPDPLSEVMTRGAQPEELVRAAPGSAPITGCPPITKELTVQVVGQSMLIHLTPSPPLEPLDLLLTGGLVVIFSVTGYAIFLRARNRPTARVASALFYCSALIFCLLDFRGNYFWTNLLFVLLAMITRGLSTTFVCLFPYPSNEMATSKRTPLLPYLPLLAGIVLAVLTLPVIPFSPEARFLLIFTAFSYNILCLLIVIGVLVWGLRHLGRNERQLARMVVIGTIFLLLPLALNLGFIKTDPFIQKSLVRLVPLPLAILPIICDYALFRDQLLGTASLFSRKLVRTLLWLLLASLFIFPIIILLRVVEAGDPRVGDQRNYIYAVLLVVSLWLFPLLWNKLRDIGDQVLYRDFYQYNRSLRDLSASLTQLQGLEQINEFVLPRLATLLNATEVALLVRARPGREGAFEMRDTPWLVYQYNTTDQTSSIEQLTGVANLARLHLKPLSQPAYTPLLLDGILLLALYDGNALSGFLCLGQKKNQEPYSRQDTSFLATLAAQLSVLEVNSRYLEQAQANARQMEALNHRVISAQEDERRRLALELHDEALQQAMLVVRQLSDASNMTEVAEVMPLARSIVASLRRTCLELRPPLLDDLGLKEALPWLARQTEQRSSGTLQVIVNYRDSREDPTVEQERPAASSELAFYRVVQEALTNVQKHARATRVHIRLRQRAGGALSLLICDNGRGFKSGQSQNEQLGLIGMQERMESIGGQFHIRTRPGRGVTIHASYQPEQMESHPMPGLEESVF